MKCFIVTCLKEYCNDVCKIFKQANINVYSTTDITGLKEANDEILSDAWFSQGKEKFDSLVIFSFTGDENAIKGMELIKNYNRVNATNFPARAFIIPVEKSSY